MEPTLASHKKFCANDFSNYLAGGSLCNAFAVGNIGSPDDFWMVGSPASSLDSYPIITGNFLGSDGKPLFRLVRNLLAVNPKGCSKISGGKTGFEIHDAEKNAILKVDTAFREDLSPKGMFVTTIHGTFYNTAGRTVAGSGGIFGVLDHDFPAAFGFSGAWGFGAGMSEMQLRVATVCVLSNGAIHEVVTGIVQNQELDLDGRLFVDATITKCKCRIRYGNFILQGKCTITANEMEVLPPALNVYQFFRGDLLASQTAIKSGSNCSIPGKYQSAGCGHTKKKFFEVGETFPTCHLCQKPIAWVKMI